MQAFASDIIGQGLMMFTKSLSDYPPVNFTRSPMPLASVSIVQSNNTRPQMGEFRVVIQL